MAGIAILGYGNVGRGVAEVITANKETINRKAREPVELRHIFDKRAFPGDAMEKYITDDIDAILGDKSISVIVEALGGAEPAFTYAKRALTGGKCFITSNKELVASHGAELMRIASDADRSFLFEASVGGGMPVIRPLADNLCADDILELCGILNGTTNYILSKMDAEDMSYDDALAQAQATGYAEKNPREDTEGFDAARKLAILLSVITGKQVDHSDIPTTGISRVTSADILRARESGRVIKLIASCVKTPFGYSAKVAPMLVPRANALSGVDGALNAALVCGGFGGQLLFMGAGAGSLPTGAAMAADIINAVNNPGFNRGLFWSAEKYRLAGPDEWRSRFDLDTLF